MLLFTRMPYRLAAVTFVEGSFIPQSPKGRSAFRDHPFSGYALKEAISLGPSALSLARSSRLAADITGGLGAGFEKRVSFASPPPAAAFPGGGGLPASKPLITHIKKAKPQLPCRQAASQKQPEQGLCAQPKPRCKPPMLPASASHP